MSDDNTPMDRATFHFYGELNDFLPDERRDTEFVHLFDWRGSIKDMIESLGPPHPEVELIVINGRSVDFDAIVMPDDRIDVYDRASASAVDMSDKVALRPALPPKPRFILDGHLGRLASYLRLLGFDTLYRNDYHDEELAQVAHDDDRVLLTRDIGLLKRSLVIHGRWTRSQDPKERLADILRHFDLFEQVTPFAHCLRCNGGLKLVEKSTIIDQLEPKTIEFYDEFHQCKSCGQVYWKGSHYDGLLAFIDEVRESFNAG